MSKFMTHEHGEAECIEVVMVGSLAHSCGTVLITTVGQCTYIVSKKITKLNECRIVAMRSLCSVLVTIQHNSNDSESELPKTP
jgi:hypothetical protein